MSRSFTQIFSVIVIAAGLLCAQQLLAQTSEEYSSKYNKWKRQYAEDCIRNLKTGALVVRLNTKSTAIGLYRNNDQDYIADRIDQKQLEENRELVKAFLSEFDFCKVYFIYTDDLDSLYAGKKKGLFLSDRLKIDTSIVLQESFYMVAGYGHVAAETYIIPGDTAAPKEYVNKAAIDRALVVKDSTNWQMAEPFPYFVHATMEKYVSKHVRVLNNKLHNYYNYVRRQ